MPEHPSGPQDDAATPDLSWAASAASGGDVDADLIRRVEAYEAGQRAISAPLSRIVTRLVANDQRAAYEWRLVDDTGRVLRRSATVLVFQEGQDDPEADVFGSRP